VQDRKDDVHLIDPPSRQEGDRAIRPAPPAVPPDSDLGDPETGFIQTGRDGFTGEQGDLMLARPSALEHGHRQSDGTGHGE
jgi:hypothetical protein